MPPLFPLPSAPLLLFPAGPAALFMLLLPLPAMWLLFPAGPAGQLPLLRGF
jgi:hypothetical protein